MTLRARRLSHTNATIFSQWALVLALGACVSTSVHATNVGHSRVVSSAGAPLRILVPLDNLTSEDRASLKVTLANAAAWQRAGLQPPVPLDSLRVSVQNGAQVNRKNIRIESTQPLATSTVDLLLDLQSSSGRRQVQVTILVPQRAAAVPVQSARVGNRGADKTASAAMTTVRAGDSLFRIARRNAVSDADVYQMLVAIWRANPQAFIQNNMHLVRSGETLTIPDAATVRAVNATEARRIYVEQAEAFARYRGRAAAQVAGAVAVGTGANAGAGQVSTASVAGASAASPAQDRLRLSSSDSLESQADARTSEQRALQDAELRVQALQGNVDALSQAASGTTATAAATDAAGAGRTAGVADPGVTASGTITSDVDRSASGAGNSVSTGGSVAPGLAGTSSETVGSSDTTAAGGLNASGSQTQMLAPASNSIGSDAVASTGNWFADNLLIIVTAGLALIVLIVAWLLRRAGARRADENEDDDYGDAVLDTALLTRKLDGIDLDLDTPPSDEPSARGPRV